MMGISQCEAGCQFQWLVQRKQNVHTRGRSPAPPKWNLEATSIPEASSTAVSQKTAQEYDIVIVGSGNGACALLSCLQRSPGVAEDAKILLLEEGQDYMATSDVTHQANWTRSYGEQDIFRLHQTYTPQGRPIISGRAVTVGGGGSINNTMMHEASFWLEANVGRNEDYWQKLKEDLNSLFRRPQPKRIATPMARFFAHKLASWDNGAGFQDADELGRPIRNIPNVLEAKYLVQDLFYFFPTQFNLFGQRTNSGVSLVNWFDRRLRVESFQKVTGLGFDGSKGNISCKTVHVETTYKSAPTEQFTYKLKADGKLLLCAGSQTPRLLHPLAEQLGNPHIGRFVNDHILLPMGFYVIDKADQDKGVVSEIPDQYISIFGTLAQQASVQSTKSGEAWQVESEEEAQGEGPLGRLLELVGKIGRDREVSVEEANRLQESIREELKGELGLFIPTLDTFAPKLKDAVYIVSHLYLAFLPNIVKKLLMERSLAFFLTKSLLQSVIQIVLWVAVAVVLVNNRVKGPEGKKIFVPDIITYILKFNPRFEGHYDFDEKNICLKPFQVGVVRKEGEDGEKMVRVNWDKEVAKDAIKKYIRVIDTVASKPPWIIQVLFRLLTNIPYEESQVDSYVEKYSTSYLLTEQHLAGGCLFGAALDKGEENAKITGLVKGSTNIHVADLSTVPLPCCSPQMTAYAVGYHVGQQLFGKPEFSQEEQFK